MELIQKYFPHLTEKQLDQFTRLQGLYEEWNLKINVISRKDIGNLYERHVLHSLTIAHYFSFEATDRVLDVGTGGGFPGIPLAILFPETQFHLVDSIAKKIKVVQGVAEALGLENVTASHIRAEKVEGKFDFVVSRAVTNINSLFYWVRKKIKKSGEDMEIKNGLICLKGGDLKEEFSEFKRYFRKYDLSEVFEEEFFETKKLVYIPL